MEYRINENCEKCEWCSLTNEMPYCLVLKCQVGLFEHCEKYIRKTGNHISH